MARVLAALETPIYPWDDAAHCMACWREIYLTALDLMILWEDPGRPVLCRSCANMLITKGTLA